MSDQPDSTRQVFSNKVRLAIFLTLVSVLIIAGAFSFGQSGTSNIQNTADHLESLSTHPSKHPVAIFGTQNDSVWQGNKQRIENIVESIVHATRESKWFTEAALPIRIGIVRSSTNYNRHLKFRPNLVSTILPSSLVLQTLFFTYNDQTIQRALVHYIAHIMSGQANHDHIWQLTCNDFLKLVDNNPTARCSNTPLPPLQIR